MKKYVQIADEGSMIVIHWRSRVHSSFSAKSNMNIIVINY